MNSRIVSDVKIQRTEWSELRSTSEHPEFRSYDEQEFKAYFDGASSFAGIGKSPEEALAGLVALVEDLDLTNGEPTYRLTEPSA